MNIIDISSVILELGLSSSITDEERAIISTAIVRAEGAVKRFINYDPVQRERTEFYPQSKANFQNRIGVWEVNDSTAYIREEAIGATAELQMQYVPIRSVASLFVDLDGRSGQRAGSFSAETEKIQGTDFWLNIDGNDSSDVGICNDGIIRSFGLWPLTPGSIKITYTSGYTIEEIHGQDSIVDASPIMDAIIGEASRRVRHAFVWKKKGNVGFVAGPFVSEKLGDYSYSLGSADNALVNRMFGGLYDLLPDTKQKLETYVNFGWSLTG